MYLKSIEVQGFKSFANKTVLDFSPGITGIVGPNGSGKSNISDAVRWVLGEQKVKQLRGASMQDVIFAGTATRRPQNYASVSISFDNSDHALSLPYEEITVSRRLYRSGESEYRLNGSECRLKDIHELFYDTGIGKEGYSLIGQGQIDKILSGKAEERRALFDEAVGIVKFKRRKDIAEKKLEEEQANLERIQDIVSELEKQVGPLEKQSEKARKYLSFRDELVVLESTHFLQKLQDTEKLLQKLEEAEKDLKATIEAEVKKQNALSESFKGLEEELLLLDEKEQEISRGNEEDESRKKTLEEEIVRLKEAISGKESSSRHFQERVNALKEEASSSIGKMEDLVSALLSMKKKFQSFLLFNTEEEKVKLDIALIDSTISEAKQIIRSTFYPDFDFDEGIQEKEDAEASSEDAKNFHAIETEIRALKKEGEEKQEAFSHLQRKRADAEKTVTDKRASLQDFLHQKERHRIQLENLQNLAERYEGFGQAVRKCMQEKEREKGLIGVVADVLKTKPEYELALETTLSGSLQNLVTEEEATAKRLLEKLKREKLGRATFLPLSSIRKERDGRYDSVRGEKGLIGVFADFVEVPKSCAGLENYLLSKVLLVDNLDNALAIARKYKHSLRIVTLDGELLQAGGALSGGAYRNSSSLIGRKREIDELVETLKAMEREEGERRASLRREEDALQELSSIEAEKREEILNLDKLYREKLLTFQGTVNAERQTLSTRVDFLTEQLHDYGERLEKNFTDQMDLEEENKNTAGSVEKDQNQIHALEEKICTLLEKEEKRKESLASLKNRRAEIAEEEKRFYKEKEGIQEELLQIEKEQLRLEHQKEKLEDQSAQSASQLFEDYGIGVSQAKQYFDENLSDNPALPSIIQEKKAEMKGLGSINLDSIEQYTEVKERYEFLRKQVEDLISSEESLREIIKDLDSGMRKQFHENFYKIQERFNEVFRVLFGGGSGKIEIDDSEDLLESGISIIAEPPGKKLQNMMQLSGGEKALTAISLLFALQSLKPSPFCLLDEIEAALDDSNVVRFAKYLHHLTKNTQFIVITHRRGTMESADRLFGVTMQEKGISTLVSVDLVEEHLQ